MLLKCLTFGFLKLKHLEFSVLTYLKLSSVPRASRIRPLQYAEESEEFPLWNAPQLQPPTGLANNWGNYTKSNKIAPKQATLISYHDIHTFLCPAFVQDPHPPTEDPRAFQAPNLLPWNNLWPRPTAAPACGGNGWLFLAQTQDKIVERS